jgi:propanol-preferring alcohol dehydrogenase
LGLSAVLFGKALGARVVGIEPTAERRHLARDLGADLLIDPTAEDPVEVLRDYTGGEGVETAIDFSANASARTAALDAAAIYGRVAFIGGGGEHPVNVSRHLIHKDLTLMGNWVFDFDAYFDMMDTIVDQGIDLERAVTHRFSLAEAEEALAVADSGRAGKVVFVWD